MYLTAGQLPRSNWLLKTRVDGSIEHWQKLFSLLSLFSLVRGRGEGESEGGRERRGGEREWGAGVCE